MSNSFCILPWISFSVLPSGEIKTCSIVNNKSGLHIKDNIENIRNDEFFKNIRRKMLSGDEPENCSKCYYREKLGLVYRNNHNIRWQKEIENNNFTENSNNFLFLDLGLTNICNLKCLMCSPLYSKRLIKEHSEYYTKKYNYKNWISDKKTFNNLLENLKNIQFIQLIGGEPLLIKELDELYQYCIDNDIAKNITLKYNTNGTIYNNKLINYWKNFKKISLIVSIDGIGKINEYIRFPSKWNTIEKNIILYKETEFNLGTHSTINIYNIFHLNEILNFNTKYNFQNSLNCVNNPSHLSIQSLPTEIKKEITELYKNINEVAHVINFMNNKDLSENFPEFIKYTKFMDLKRGNNILDINPQFKKYLNK